MTRKTAMEGHEGRLAVNVPLLDKALKLRRQIASLLGYKTWYGSFSCAVKKLITLQGRIT
jgi:Zn-dependent oligopeptidase